MEQECKEERVPRQKKYMGGGAGPATGGLFWFAGWLFTAAYLNFVWWKWIVGLVIWPYYLGVWFR